MRLPTRKNFLTLVQEIPDFCDCCAVHQCWGVARVWYLKGLRAAGLHLGKSVGQQQVALRAADRQDGRFDLLPERPHIDIERDGGAHRLDDFGVVVHGEGASTGLVERLAPGVAGELRPLSVAQVAEGRVDEAQMRLQRGQRGETLRRVRHIVPDAFEGGGGDMRADVVEHQAGDGGVLRRREHHAADAAQRGADPGDRLADDRQQMRQRHHVARGLVGHGFGQPIRLAAPGQVWTDDMELVRQRLRQRVKIPPIAGETVDAQHRRGGGVAEFDIGHFVELRAEQIIDRIRPRHADVSPTAHAAAICRLKDLM